MHSLAKFQLQEAANAGPPAAAACNVLVRVRRSGCSSSGAGASQSRTRFFTGRAGPQAGYLLSLPGRATASKSTLSLREGLGNGGHMLSSRTICSQRGQPILREMWVQRGEVLQPVERNQAPPKLAVWAMKYLAWITQGVHCVKTP